MLRLRFVLAVFAVAMLSAVGIVKATNWPQVEPTPCIGTAIAYDSTTGEMWESENADPPECSR